MFTAFDLLAKFQFGDTGGVGKRFTDFLISPSGTGMQQADAELFYAIRNSLVHAFGVPDIDALARLGLQGVEIHRRTETKDGLLTVQRKSWSGHTVAVIYVDGVFSVLHYSIGNYRNFLATSADAQKQFDTMFEK